MSLSIQNWLSDYLTGVKFLGIELSSYWHLLIIGETFSLLKVGWFQITKKLKKITLYYTIFDTETIEVFFSLISALPWITNWE